MTDTKLPPRRYSVGQSDFNPDIGRRLLIRLSGVEQRSVIEYDCDAGVVVRNALDACGRPQLNAKRDEILRERILGDVTVEWNA